MRAIGQRCENVGKTVKSSKKRYVWELVREDMPDPGKTQIFN